MVTNDLDLMQSYFFMVFLTTEAQTTQRLYYFFSLPVLDPGLAGETTANKNYHPYRAIAIAIRAGYRLPLNNFTWTAGLAIFFAHHPASGGMGKMLNPLCLCGDIYSLKFVAFLSHTGTYFRPY